MKNPLDQIQAKRLSILQIKNIAHWSRFKRFFEFAGPLTCDRLMVFSL